MAEGRSQQSQRWIVRLGWLFIAALFARFYVQVFVQPMGNNTAAQEIGFSAFVVVWLWPWGAALAFSKNPVPKRWAYTLGCLLCLLHVAIAFHLGHAWSHQAAFEHTERASGFGAGIFVNYLFVLVWVADALWAWVALEHYLKRPGWANALIIGFMGFIMFNAAVVFASGPMRWLSLGLLVVPWLLLPFEVTARPSSMEPPPPGDPVPPPGEEPGRTP